MAAVCEIVSFIFFKVVKKWAWFLGRIGDGGAPSESILNNFLLAGEIREDEEFVERAGDEGVVLF